MRMNARRATTVPVDSTIPSTQRLPNRTPSSVCYHRPMDVPATPALALARELIARRSLTPDDAGCQALLAARLEPLGFRCDTLESNGVTNLWARRGAAAP